MASRICVIGKIFLKQTNEFVKIFTKNKTIISQK